MLATRHMGCCRWRFHIKTPVSTIFAFICRAQASLQRALQGRQIGERAKLAQQHVPVTYSGSTSSCGCRVMHSSWALTLTYAPGACMGQPVKPGGNGHKRCSMMMTALGWEGSAAPADVLKCHGAQRTLCYLATCQAALAYFFYNLARRHGLHP